MPETPNTVKKQVYVSKENLQKVLEYLKTQNETLSRIVPGKLSTSCMNFSDFDAVQEGFISVSCISAEPVSTGIVDGISFSL